MTLKVKQDGVFVATGGGAAADEFGWVRPAAWPAFPAIDDTDEKFIGLVGVSDVGGERLSLTCQGAYTVDWGDGTVEDVASNTSADHLYDFANATLYSHPDLPYKVATVTVTPQAAAQLTHLTLYVSYNGVNNGTPMKWLDIAVSMPNCAANGLVLGTLNGNVNSHLSLGRVRILNWGSYAGAASLFDGTGFNAVRSITLPANAISSDQITNISSWFRALRLLKLPMLNTSQVTNAQTTFLNCAAPIIPAYDLSSATNLAGTFSSRQTQRIMATGMKVSFPVLNCSLSRAALVELFTNLADLTALTGQTLTITGNWGIADLTAEDREIATDKNWTLVE